MFGRSINRTLGTVETMAMTLAYRASCAILVGLTFLLVFASQTEP